MCVSVCVCVCVSFVWVSVTSLNEMGSRNLRLPPEV